MKVFVLISEQECDAGVCAGVFTDLEKVRDCALKQCREFAETHNEHVGEAEYLVVTQPNGFLVSDPDDSPVFWSTWTYETIE